MKIHGLLILFLCSALTAFAQTTPPATDYQAEPQGFNFLGVRLGMTADEAIAAFNIKTLPDFSGYATPIHAERSGNDHYGYYQADYGPTSNYIWLGKRIAAITYRMTWMDGRAKEIEVINTELTYEKALGILSSDYGKPEITSEQDPDPDGIISRYAEWHYTANTATDTLRVFLYKDNSRDQKPAGITVERRPTKAVQFEMKTKTEWEKDYAAAATAANPGLAYFNLCARQFNIASSTRAMLACNKAIAVDPQRADTYYIKANLIFFQASETLDNGHYHFPPETAGVLKKYLELAPTGAHAAEVKQMFDMVNNP